MNTDQAGRKKRQTLAGMYDARDPSSAQRITMSALLGLCVAVVWWLLAGDGITSGGRLVDWIGGPGDRMRRILLAIVLSVYYIRLHFTWFVFLKRGVSWAEAFTIIVWVWCIFLALSLAGGTNPDPLQIAGGVGLGLFVLGSWMNSYAEFARYAWKRRPENLGRLYTGGLFRLSRRPNYLGDLISFSGICLITGRVLTAIIPLMMLGGFVFASIPMLDAHLHVRYGADFDEYASRTRKLIPFLY